MTGMLVNAYALGATPKTFNSLQIITRNVNVNVAADDGTGRTNGISDGTLISGWGKSVSGYTHIRIGTSNIMKITGEGAYNFYGFFVDTFGNKLPTSPFTSSAPISSFTLVTYV